MSEIKLGKLLEKTEGRDAVHVAICPVQAGQQLKPGEHISVKNGLAYNYGKHIGIVDPFLETNVKRGDKFYIVLYPNSITTLRHVWTHPDFEPEVENTDYDIEVLKLAATQCSLSYDFFLDSLNSYAEFGSYQHMGEFESYQNVLDWNEVWQSWSNVTGKPVPEEAWCPFTCSC